MPIDPRVYDAPQFDTVIPGSAQAAPAPYVAPEPVPQRQILVGTPETAQANLVAQQNARQGVSVSETLAASVSEWDTTKLIERWSGPTFEPEEGFNPRERTAQLDSPLDEAQREFLNKSQSADELEARIGMLDQSRLNMQRVGDNAILGVGAMMLDPVYLGIDVASLGAGRIMAAAKVVSGVQRLSSGVTAGAGAAAVLGGVSTQRPVSNAEVVGMSLLNGAMGAAFYNPVTRRVELRDPEYPVQQLTAIAQPGAGPKVADEATAAAVQAEIKVGPTIQAVDTELPPLVAPAATPAPATAPTAAGPATLPKALSGAAPRYSYGSKGFTLQFDADIDRAAYIASQPKPSKRDADFVKFVRDNTGMSDAEVRARGNAIRDSIKAQAKDAPAGKLHVGTDGSIRRSKNQHVTPEVGDPQSAKAELMSISNSADPMIAATARRMHALMGEDVKMGVGKDTKRSFYSVKDNAVYMRPDAPDSVKLHEIAHAMTANRVRFGKANPDTEIGKLTSQIEAIRARAALQGKSMNLPAASKYYLDNIDEFMAGLYSNDAAFIKYLAQLPSTDGSKSLLGELVQVVRQILGMNAKDGNAFLEALGLTDELMQSTAPAKGPGLKASAMNEMDMHEAGAAIVKQEDKLAAKAGRKISISLHKSMSNFGTKGKETADLLVDNPLDFTGDSVVSQQRAIRADLMGHQFNYEDSLKSAMAAQGFGIRNRIFQPRKALAAQAKIERSVMEELWSREQSGRLGTQWQSQAAPEIRKMADEVDAANRAALDELKKAGTPGAENVVEQSGYVSRKWDGSKLNDIETLLTNAGDSVKEAQAKIHSMVSRSLRSGNIGWSPELSDDIAKAILDRSRRKSMFEDSALNSGVGDIGALRDILTGSGIKGDRLQMALDMLAGVVDEAGKSPVLKKRVDLDMNASMLMPDGSSRKVGDLLNTDLARIQDGYLDHVAGRAALARKGLGDGSAIANLRRDFLAAVPSEAERGKAASMFDDTINAIQGNPVGEQMAQWMRDMQAVTRMVGLASSGLWQITEFATALHKYGAVSVMRNLGRSMPGAAKLMSNVKRDGSTATELHSILTRNSSADIRLRPFISKMEDNFDMAVSSQASLALNQAQQLVPYLNAQKLVQNTQARLVANCAIDSLIAAAKGNKGAINMWRQYGLEQPIMEAIKADLLNGITDTAKWSDGAWDKVRGPLVKAMDDAVLRNRTGEIPAFAQFSQVGKFIFTFRSFVLGAHNKVLSGTLARDGVAGTSMLMLYQLPLAYLATQANAKIQNNPIDPGEDFSKAITQMGSLGLFSEVAGVITGQKQQFGAPGLLFIDRLYKTVGAAAKGNFTDAAATAVSATPILSIFPTIRGVGAALKE